MPWFHYSNHTSQIRQHGRSQRSHVRSRGPEGIGGRPQVPTEFRNRICPATAAEFQGIPTHTPGFTFTGGESLHEEGSHHKVQKNPSDTPFPPWQHNAPAVTEQLPTTRAAPRRAAAPTAVLCRSERASRTSVLQHSERSHSVLEISHTQLHITPAPAELPSRPQDKCQRPTH